MTSREKNIYPHTTLKVHILSKQSGRVFQIFVAFTKYLNFDNFWIVCKIFLKFVKNIDCSYNYIFFSFFLVWLESKANKTAWDSQLKSNLVQFALYHCHAFFDQTHEIHGRSNLFIFIRENNFNLTFQHKVLKYFMKKICFLCDDSSN